MTSLKEKLVAACLRELEGKEALLRTELKALRKDAAGETKSSMGDKYETGREMMRQAEEKVMSQLFQVQQQRVDLKRISPEKTMDRIRPGCLIETKTDRFFVCISYGRLEIDGEVYFLISPKAPIYQALLGCGAGDEVRFNGKRYGIVSIV